VAESYDEKYSGAFWMQIYDKNTWHYIEPYLPENGVVLDAGGRTGKWVTFRNYWQNQSDIP
jgi:hypothetical protein